MLYSIRIYVSEDAVAAMSADEEEAHVAEHLKIHTKLSAKNQIARSEVIAHMLVGLLRSTTVQLARLKMFALPPERNLSWR